MTETNVVAFKEKGEALDLAGTAVMLRNAAAETVRLLANRKLPPPGQMEEGPVAGVGEEVSRRVLATCERVLRTPLPPPGPCVFGLRENRASIRRRIDRLRAGLAEPGQPADLAELAKLADTMEKQLEYRDFVLSVCWEVLKVAALMCRELFAALRVLPKEKLALFPNVKQLPVARDPDNPLSIEILHIHHERRSTSLGPARTDEGKRLRWPRRKR